MGVPARARRSLQAGDSVPQPSRSRENTDPLLVDRWPSSDALCSRRQDDAHHGANPRITGCASAASRYGCDGHRSAGHLPDALFDGSHRASGSFSCAATQLQSLACRSLRRVPRPVTVGLLAAIDEYRGLARRIAFRQRSRCVRHSQKGRFGGR